MPDKKLTDSEIVKALECCTQGRDIRVCWNCPLYVDLETARECCEKLNTNALDLINRLQAENEKWQEVAFKHEDTMQIIVTEKQYYFDKLQNAKAKIESLKRQLHNAKLHQKETHKALQDEKALRLNEDFIKAEAYKEFAERLKEKADKLKHVSVDGKWAISQYDIDDLLKELVGALKGKAGEDVELEKGSGK